ncbi:MAG: hypothetical protein ACM3NQ_09405, partial [Bacteroidales bacterium]
AQEQPDIWLSNRPARGGEAGAMFERIIKRALALKAGAAPPEEEKRPARPASGQKVGKAPKRASVASTPKNPARRPASKRAVPAKKSVARKRSR